MQSLNVLELHNHNCLAMNAEYKLSLYKNIICSLFDLNTLPLFSLAQILPNTWVKMSITYFCHVGFLLGPISDKMEPKQTLYDNKIFLKVGEEDYFDQSRFLSA